MIDFKAKNDMVLANTIKMGYGVSDDSIIGGSIISNQSHIQAAFACPRTIKRCLLVSNYRTLIGNMGAKRSLHHGI